MDFAVKRLIAFGEEPARKPRRRGKKRGTAGDPLSNGSNTPNEALKLNTREILLYPFLILIFCLSLEIDFDKINSAS